MLFLSPLGCLPSTSKATLGSSSVRACCVPPPTRHQVRRRVISATSTRSLPRASAASWCNSSRNFSSSAYRTSAISEVSSASPLPPSLRARIEAYLQAQRGKASEATFPSDQQSFIARVIGIRKHSKVTFLSVTDGSTSSSTLLQVVLTAESYDAVDREWKEKGRPPLGVADTVLLTGTFAVRSRQQGTVTTSSAIEFKVEQCTVLGSSDRESSPLLQKPGNDAASVSGNNAQRQQPHLRSLLPGPAATMRFRSRLEMAMASFFAQHDFIRTTPPIMTASDCEGAGEVFRVVDGSHETTAATGDKEKQESSPAYLTVSTQLHLEALMLGLSRVYTFTPAFRAEDSDTNRHLREFWMCEAELATRGESASEELEMLMTFVEDLIKSAASTAFGDAFSAVEAAEGGAEAVSTPYSTESDVSPNATATLDALYLWGLEAERRRSPTTDETKLSQQDRRRAQLSSFGTFASNLSPTTRWPRITYTDTLKLLERKHASKHPFLRPPPVWGEGLGSEHEKWLSEEHVGGPVFVVDYPASSKPFYMRLAKEEEKEEHQGREIVKNFDLLVPHIGELVGGSLREDDPSILLSRLKSLHLLPSNATAIPQEHPLYWYVEELRKNGLGPHGGFGMGVERLVAWMAGRGSVRECIPFPRVGRKVRF
ncbi:class II aaRS and biotin synthetase [Microstroma glucosiphilum]|uniref:Class II aaRS and biotin synthetase n=1 Tax=Pseudomicrostroma glucosiphilum TaxID=1684307 RepID=A0A316TWG6_9BASI|nr:class II aaRS and biotin synthetase [Pseudomicrostroma glucosiphilum]PWN17779.1 class II aaRS and biotin synthetase [Pseudomicrostroma glucosiphilum]